MRARALLAADDPQDSRGLMQGPPDEAQSPHQPQPRAGPPQASGHAPWQPQLLPPYPGARTAGAHYVPPPPPPHERKWIPVIVLTTVILFVVFGGFFVAAAIDVPGRRAEAGPPVTVSGVRFGPRPGWVVARRLPGETPAIQLTKGSGNLLAVVFPGEGDASVALERYRDEILAPEALNLEVSSDVERVPHPSAGSALRAFYVGTFQDNPSPLEGDVTAFALPSGGVVFDGWAQEGTYQQFADDVHGMASGAEPA